MSDRKEQLEREEAIRVEVGADGSYGIGWTPPAWPGGNILLRDSSVRSEITMAISFGDCVIEEEQCKKMHISISADGLMGEVSQTKPVTAFHDDGHAIRWVQYMIEYLNSHLYKRLRTMAVLTVREAIAKSSEVHSIAQTDWKKLAETHGAIVAEKIKDSHGVHSGPARFFETAQQYLNFLAEAARASRATGKRFTQAWVADLANKKFGTEGIDERTIRQWNKDHHVNWNYFAAKVNRRN